MTWLLRTGPQLPARTYEPCEYERRNSELRSVQLISVGIGGTENASMRRWVTLMLLTFAVTLLFIFHKRSADDELDRNARMGLIERDAPIKASLTEAIDAPPETVWQVLTSIDDWPHWQPGIHDARLEGPLSLGAQFKWSTGNLHIESTIVLLEPDSRIAWTGSAMGAKAVHVWVLTRQPGNKTLVAMDESMSGPLLTWFYTSKELAYSDKDWLDRLKLEAEREASQGRGVCF
jgi:uncharacterized protein YndB with AHSA1/START domain